MGGGDPSKSDGFRLVFCRTDSKNAASNMRAEVNAFGFSATSRVYLLQRPSIRCDQQRGRSRTNATAFVHFAHLLCQIERSPICCTPPQVGMESTTTYLLESPPLPSPFGSMFGVLLRGYACRKNVGTHEVVALSFQNP